MKETVSYTCEFCHTRYDDKEEALRCEKGHKRVTKIVGCHYLSHNADIDGTPYLVEIELEDSSVVRYRRAK